jgi:ATP/maltotriose-dependent transcriptional regulator MalT
MRDLLNHGRECHARRAWCEACEALGGADRENPLAPDDLERLWTAAFLAGHDPEWQGYLERLHRQCVESVEPERAARCAFWLAMDLLTRGELGHASAWIARGQRLVRERDCVERGYLLLPVAEQQLRDGHADTAHATAADATAIGERFRDADLEAAARHVQGRALILQGRVRAGLARLDEAMLSVVAGELSPIMTGLMYCSVIGACREVYAWGRAREWTAAFSRACEQQEMAAFTGTCLVHRAAIMILQGAWPDAMAEAGRACDRSVRAARRPPAAAIYQQAEIHRLRGDFARAEEGYREASRLGLEPQPGLTLLRMAQGRTDAARAAICRLETGTLDRAGRARLLPAHVEIMLAADDLGEARRAGVELEALAEAFDTDVLRATAAQARGAIALAEGDPRAALDPLRSAFGVWQRLDAPYEAARARVLLAQACGELGDHDAAELEIDAARAAFERLGAKPDLARLESVVLPDTSPPAHPLTAREIEVLRLVSAGGTNRAIADRLCVSERTIDRHVSNILGKLGVPSRTAATAYAYDHKLI